MHTCSLIHTLNTHKLINHSANNKVPQPYINKFKVAKQSTDTFSAKQKNKPLLLSYEMATTRILTSRHFKWVKTIKTQQQKA